MTLLQNAGGVKMPNVKKLTEQTSGNHIFMRLSIDDEVFEISCYCGTDYKWNHYKTTADGTEKRQAVIDAFNLLY